MDLTDILFSKPFIGSSSGGDSDIETATIEITVTDGTATITSGEFPKWCIAATSDYIYGKIVLENVYISGGGESITGSMIVVGVVSMGATDGVISIAPETGYGIGVAKDLSFVGNMSNASVTSGTITITLIYVPED